MRWRSAAALTFVGLGVILIGAAPPSTPEQRIERWSRRVADRLDEMRVVGVDTEGYRAELRRARDLAEGEFTEEALLVLRTLVRDIEGWDPAPAPPRKPIEALRDVDRGPLPWAPEDRPVDDPWKIRGEPPSSGQPLPESAGYGSFRNSSRLRSRHHMVPEGEGARVVTDADRVGHRMRPSHIKAAHSAAARRTATWMEEADRVDGAVQGRPIRRSGGGTVLQREHGDPAAREPFTPAGHGMHDEDALPPDAVRPPAHTALALEGARGVGIYGGPRRQVRARIHPVETPDLPPRSDALTGEAGYGRYVPGATPVRPSRPVDFGTPPLATEMASAGGLDPDDLSADLGDAGDLGGDLGGDLDGDLGGGDLDGDLGGDLEGDLDGDLGGDLGGGLGGDLEGDLPGGENPFEIRAGETLDAARALNLRSVFRMSPEEKAALSGSLIRLRGHMGRPERTMRPHVRNLAGLQRIRGYALFSLHDGPVGVDVLVSEELTRGKADAEPVEVVGRYLYAVDDPDAVDQGFGQLVAAKSVEPIVEALLDEDVETPVLEDPDEMDSSMGMDEPMDGGDLEVDDLGMDGGDLEGDLEDEGDDFSNF